MLKGYMVRERLRTPALGHANFFDDSLRLAIRCLPTLDVILFFDVTAVLFIPADRMPGHEKMPELSA